MTSPITTFSVVMLCWASLFLGFALLRISPEEKKSLLPSIRASHMAVFLCILVIPLWTFASHPFAVIALLLASSTITRTAPLLNPSPLLLAAAGLLLACSSFALDAFLLQGAATLLFMMVSAMIAFQKKKFREALLGLSVPFLAGAGVGYLLLTIALSVS